MTMMTMMDDDDDDDGDSDDDDVAMTMTTMMTMMTVTALSHLFVRHSRIVRCATMLLTHTIWRGPDRIGDRKASETFAAKDGVRQKF